MMTQDIGCQFTNIPGFEVTKYASTPYVGNYFLISAASIGSYCLPDDQNLQDQLLQNANL
jgi:hypothetical protein